MKGKLCAVALLVTLFVTGSPAWAHHGASAYDLDKSVTAKATVTSLTWTNPHTLLNFTMKDDKGNVQEWHCEMYNPLYMERAGWTKDILKDGDEITVTFHPTKNGSPNGIIRAGDGKVVFNGKELSLVELDDSGDSPDQK